MPSIWLQNQNFTNTDGTALSSHSDEGGVSYSKHPSFSDVLTIQSNRVGKDSNTGTTAYYASPTPPQLVYVVEADIVDVGEVDRAMGIVGWLDTATDSMIVLRRQNRTTFQFLKIISGSATSLATITTSFSVGISRRLKLRRLAGNLFEASIDGSVFGGSISITDSVFLSVGKAGIRASNNHLATGYHIDNLIAYIEVAPDAPSSLIATAISSTQVDLSWTDNSDNEDSFRIERKTGAGGTYAEISSNSANDVTFSDLTVSPSTTYFYRVRARNTFGDSAYLSEQSVTTPGGPPPSTTLMERLASNVTFICPLWKITAKDGTIAAYCEHTRPLTFNSQAYTVAATELTRPLQRIGLQPNSIEIIGVFDEVITRKDLELGRWKGASIVYEYVDYLDLSLGSTGKITGYVGKVQPLNSVAYKLEILSKSDALQPLLGDLTSPVDRNTFPAGVNVATFTFSAQVKQVTGPRQFKVDHVQSSANFFRYGLVRFTSGENDGTEMEVKTSNTTDSETRTELFLQLPMSGVVAVNDTVELVAGYDGTREQLRDRYDDVLDGDFEPDLPGLKAVLKYPE